MRKGSKHSPEAIEKNRLAHVGNQNLLGFKFSKASKKKMSLSHILVKNLLKRLDKIFYFGQLGKIIITGKVMMLVTEIYTGGLDDILDIQLFVQIVDRRKLLEKELTFTGRILVTNI